MPDEDKSLPAPPPEIIEHSEKGSLRGSAAVADDTPSAQYVRPATMNLAGPPVGDDDGGSSASDA